MIVVVGSLNMDLVVRLKRHVRPGETLLGSDYEAHPGGKGANQAVAAARAGGQVRMIGRVGNDVFGDTLLDGLAAAGIDARAVQRSERPSGVAFITIDSQGQNSIIVAPGANAALSPADLTARLFSRTSVVLLQLEIPLPTVLAAARLGRAAGALTILNLAPAQKLNAGELSNIDLLLVNENEAALLLELDEAAIRAEPLQAVARLARLVPQAVLTLGADGAAWTAGNGSGLQRGFPVTALDTTGAGDAFTGALAVALAEGLELPQAVRFGAAAGALATTGVGAQSALPRRDAIMQLLALESSS
jgi:ribokinase